jgi:hypothetical protein
VRDVVALAAQWMLARPSLYAIPASVPALQLGEMVYHTAGQPAAISHAARRVARRALAADPAAVQARRVLAQSHIDAANRGSRAVPRRTIDDGDPGYLRLALLASADALPAGLPVARIGVLRGYPITLDEHPNTAAILATNERAGPGARTLRDRLLTMPTHARVGVRDARALVNWVQGET